MPADVAAPLIKAFRHGAILGLGQVKSPRPQAGTLPPAAPVPARPVGRRAPIHHRPAHPPTSNQAERDLRPAKTEQKISGRLRSEQVTRHRYAIRGYISTARHGQNAMTARRDALTGSPWTPPLPDPPSAVASAVLQPSSASSESSCAMSPAEPTVNPGEPSHEGTAPPPPGSAGPAAGWRPLEPPLIAVDPAFALDRWRPADSAALRRMDLDPDTARFFGYTVEQARALPDSHYDGDGRARASLWAWRAGRELNLAIRRHSDGEAAGWVELRLAGSEAEVSYNVTAELRGQGIASRALQAFLTWAAQQIGLRRAHLACRIDNLASRRVAEKCGFALLGQQGEEYQFRRDLDPAERPI